MTSGEDDASLRELGARIDRLGEEHRYRAQRALLEEALPRARAARDLQATIHFLFGIMNGADLTMEPLVQRERAIELIALVESEDAARRVQPDLAEEAYAYQRWSVTACAYDNLAKAAACIEGYNSDGMQSALVEGMEKVRQSGKTQCLTCFREYGVRILVCADDLDLATSQARYLAHRDKELAIHDRRVVGWKELAWVQLLRGDARGALQSLEKAHEVAGEFHDPWGQRLDIACRLEMIWRAIGKADEWDAFARAHPVQHAPPPRGECNFDDWVQDWRDATVATLAGDHAHAIAVHERWCAWFDEKKNLDKWFDQRTWLAAAYLMAGRREDAERIARETDEKAQAVRNWVTRRQLRELLRAGATPNPFATLEPLRDGPAPVAASPPDDASQVSIGGVPAAPPSQMAQDFDRWRERARESAEARAAVAREVLSVAPGTLEVPDDARWWLRAAFLLREQDLPKAWRSARLLAKRFERAGYVLSLVAALGAAVRDLPPEIEVDRPTDEDLALLHRKALDLSPDDDEVHQAAGAFFAGAGDLAEAERCFARASRLDRTWSVPALALARIYRETDRPNDALELLDLVIRCGSRDPQVAWEASLCAFHERAWERCVTYLALFLETGADPKWANYFRALALLELGRFDDAFAAAEEERRLNPTLGFALDAIEARARAGAAKLDEAARLCERALATPLRDADTLTPTGLAKILQVLRSAALATGDEKLQARATERTLRSGLAGSPWLDEERTRPGNAERPDLTVFEIALEQLVPPDQATNLDVPKWEIPWKAYRVIYGVLCSSPEEATRFAIDLQARCAPGAPPPRVLAVEPGRSGFTDQPGIVFQSMREAVEPEDAE